MYRVLYRLNHRLCLQCELLFIHVHLMMHVHIYWRIDVMYVLSNVFHDELENQIFMSMKPSSY